MSCVVFKLRQVAVPTVYVHFASCSGLHAGGFGEELDMMNC